MWNSCTSVLPNTCAWEQQDWNKTIKDKGEEGKKKGMNVERSTVGTKKSLQPKRQKSLNLLRPMLKIGKIYLTGSAMIWCDAQKKEDCRISLPGFWLYLPYALPYRQLLFETSQSVCWNLVLQKECIEFYLNSFSNHFHCTILSLFSGLSLHIFLTARDY